MIVQLTGGLGNQMFGYAFGRSLALARGEEVFFTRNQVDGNTHGGYLLHAFATDIRFAGKLMPPIYNEPHFHFDPNAINAVPGSSYVGYWQSEKYFDVPTIRNDFKFKTLYLDISEQPLAFIHVRRGDYLKEPHKSWHGVLPLDYYRAGVAQILASEPDVKFLIFSDDPNWCEQNFPSSAQGFVNPFAHKFKIMRGDCGPIHDLALMSLCKHAVIANSSFSWWGAWLGGSGNDRMVIAPKQWFATPTLDTSDLIPNRWMRI